MYRLALVALATFLPSLAAAQAVSFDEAIAFSRQSPELRGTERAIEVRRQGDAHIAGTSQGLAIEATPGIRILSEPDRGFEGTLSIAHSWNLGDLTGARRRAARAERDVLDAERRALALSLRLDAARRWLVLWRIERLVELVHEEGRLAEELTEATARAVAAGVRTRVDQAELEAYLAEVALRAAVLEGERHDASIELSVAMAREPNSELRPAGDPPRPALPDRVDIERVEQLPQVAVERLAAAAARAREAEEAAGYAPLLSLGAQIQRESPDGVIALGVVGMSIPLFDRGQRARSIARAEAAQREGRATQARLEATRELVLAVHEVEHERRQEREIAERLVPALERLVEGRAALLRAGEGTIFALLDARRRGLEARAQAVDAQAARAWAELKLWLLLAELERAGDAEGR